MPGLCATTSAEPALAGRALQGRQPRLAGGVVEGAVQLDRPGELHRGRGDLGGLLRARRRGRDDCFGNLPELGDRAADPLGVVAPAIGQDPVEVLLAGNPDFGFCVSQQENRLHAANVH